MDIERTLQLPLSTCMSILFEDINQVHDWDWVYSKTELAYIFCFWDAFPSTRSLEIVFTALHVRRWLFRNDLTGRVPDTWRGLQSAVDLYVTLYNSFCSISWFPPAFDAQKCFVLIIVINLCTAKWRSSDTVLWAFSFGEPTTGTSDRTHYQALFLRFSLCYQT